MNAYLVESAAGAYDYARALADFNSRYNNDRQIFLIRETIEIMGENIPSHGYFKGMRAP